MHHPRLLILLFLFGGIKLAAQDFYESDFVPYTTSDGLSHNTVSGIAQDSVGYVWASTSAGLNRYNGNRFVQFHSNDDSSSLVAEELTGLTWIDKYRFAAYSYGLHIVDTRTGNTHNILVPYHQLQYQYKFNNVMAVLGDKDGSIYALTRSGFYHFDKDYRLVSRFDYYKEDEVPIQHFVFGRYLHELDENRLLIISIDGLYIYDKKKKAVKKMEYADCPMLGEFLDYPGPSTTLYHFFQVKPGVFFVMNLLGDSVTYINIAELKRKVSITPIKYLRSEFHYRSKIIADSDTLFYVTSHGSGFYKMRLFPETGAVKFYPEKYLPSYLCYAMMKDKDNNMWVATNRGLLRQDRGRAQVQQASMPAGITDTLPYLRFCSVYVYGDKIYAGTRDNGGLLVYDKASLRFLAQVRNDGFNDNLIGSIVQETPSSLVLGTGGLLFTFNITSQKRKVLMPPRWSEGNWASDVFRDSKGKIWISTAQIFRYDPLAKTYDFIPSYERLLSQPTAIREDRDGNMWMAGHGLARYNTSLNKYDIVLDSFPFVKMHDKQVNAILIDKQNTIWFNSNNNGLIAYCIDKKTFRHFTRKDGLPDDNIASMIMLGQKLWIATFSGIACLDLQTSEIVSFGREDGFPQMPVVRGSQFFYDSSAQQLYLGFSGAIIRFKPNDILRRKSPPRVFVESLSINGKNNMFLPGRSVTTSWQDNEFMITIGSINFSDSYSQRFAYRIVKDENSPWQELGNESTFNVSNLSPGNYRVQVRSFSSNNRWPAQIKELNIAVLPPFWKEGWFVGIMIGLALMALYLFVHWRTNVARKKEMEKTHIEKLKADDYKNQFELEHISHYFSSSLAGKKTQDEVLWDVAANLIGKMNYVDCIIYSWNDDKTKMVQKAAYGPKGKPEYISEQFFDVSPGQGVVGQVIETRQPLLIKDTRKDSRYRVDDAFRLSEICVPIVHNDELLGIIDSEHDLPDYFTERDIQILTTIATLIGNKLKQIESERSLEVKRKELATTNEQLAEARLSALQAQMNPHFVFNALNSIKRMILDRDNEKASRYLSKFALMIRMTLNHSKETFVTLEENIEYLKAYLEMEQLRFDESFTYQISTADNIDTVDSAIPSLMIQPIVENAIWHGLLQAEADKNILIGFTQCDNRITCTVEDNGIGIKRAQKLKETNKPPHQSVGLENLKKRIKIMNEKYDTDCSLEITDLGDAGNGKRGTRVVLRFNVINT
jgi:ligand-binding sensor domain-containing protein/putative methionine-R-sulfoxide reductase with GAF domain